MDTKQQHHPHTRKLARTSMAHSVSRRSKGFNHHHASSSLLPPFHSVHVCRCVCLHHSFSFSLTLTLSVCVISRFFARAADAPSDFKPIAEIFKFRLRFFTLSVGSGCDIKEAVKKRACFITHATRKGAELRVKLGWKGYGTVTDRLGLVNSRARKRGYFDRKGLF